MEVKKGASFSCRFISGEGAGAMSAPLTSQSEVARVLREQADYYAVLRIGIGERGKKEGKRRAAERESRD